MKKNYLVTITDGKQSDTFNLSGKSKEAVKELCTICHLGTGWRVKEVGLAMKKKKVFKPFVSQLCLF